jgi:hypothetical protein
VNGWRTRGVFGGHWTRTRRSEGVEGRTGIRDLGSAFARIGAGRGLPMIVFAIIWGAAIVALGWNLGGVASTTTNLEETVERIDQIRHEIAEIRIDLQAEEAEELREELRLLVDRARCLDPFGEMLEVPECQ